MTGAAQPGMQHTDTTDLSLRSPTTMTSLLPSRTPFPTISPSSITPSVSLLSNLSWPSSSSSSPPPPGPTGGVSEEEAPCSLDDEALRVPLAVLYSLLFACGLVGNLLALWVFLRIQDRRNSVHVLLINCAVADLVLLACLPFRVLYHARGNRWALGSVACSLVGNVFYMNMYVSITLLGLISLDRYARLRGRPQRGSATGTPGGRRRLWAGGARRAWAACGLLWALSLALLVPMIAAREGNEVAGKCFQFKRRRGARAKAYVNVALVALFWAVFVALAVSHGKVAARLLRAARSQLPNARRYGRTARKSFFVLFLFTVCFAPYHAFRPIYILAQISDAPQPCSYLTTLDHTNEVMLLFSAFNSCLDPIMYFLLSGSVRKAAVRALGRRLGGGQLPFLAEATSNSSTAEFRRPPSQCMTPPSQCMTPPTCNLSPTSFMSGTDAKGAASRLPLSGARQ